MSPALGSEFRFQPLDLLPERLDAVIGLSQVRKEPLDLLLLLRYKVRLGCSALFQPTTEVLTPLSLQVGVLGPESSNLFVSQEKVGT